MLIIDRTDVQKVRALKSTGVVFESAKHPGEVTLTKSPIIRLHRDMLVKMSSVEGKILYSPLYSTYRMYDESSILDEIDAFNKATNNGAPYLWDNFERVATIASQKRHKN